MEGNRCILVADLAVSFVWTLKGKPFCFMVSNYVYCVCEIGYVYMSVGVCGICMCRSPGTGGTDGSEPAPYMVLGTEFRSIANSVAALKC